MIELAHAAVRVFPQPARVSSGFEFGVAGLAKGAATEGSSARSTTTRFTPGRTLCLEDELVNDLADRVLDDASCSRLFQLWNDGPDDALINDRVQGQPVRI